MMLDRRHFLLSLAVPPLAASLSGCSALGTLNAVIPKDGGSKLAGSGLAYGPDPRQKLDVYVPSGGAKPKGTIVFIYGGSWSSGSRSEYGFVGRAFAARGFVTMIADYRLVPTVRYPGFVADCAKAVAWAYRNTATYGGGPDRLFVMGHSAGAYNAIMVAVAPELLQSEGLSPRILRGAAGLSGPYDFLPLEVDATREAFKGVADLKRTQPVNRVGRAYVPPMILVTGDADTTVLPRNTRNLAAAMRRNGHDVRTEYYPGLKHADTLLAIARPLRNKAPVVDQVVAFFDAH